MVRYSAAITDYTDVELNEQIEKVDLELIKLLQQNNTDPVWYKLQLDYRKILIDEQICRFRQNGNSWL